MRRPAVSRATYSDLFAAIGTTYGAGDGSTTFNLPDLRGRVAAGRDDMGGSAANRITNGGSGIVGTTLGAAGGAETHTLTTAQIPSHSHTIRWRRHDAGVVHGPSRSRRRLCNNYNWNSGSDRRRRRASERAADHHPELDHQHMTVGGISLRDLHLVWPDLWPLLEPAVKRSPDKPDVLARLIARDAQLWAVYEGDRPVAAIVTHDPASARRSAACCG